MKPAITAALLALALWGANAHAALLYTAEIKDRPNLPKMRFEVEIDEPEIGRSAVRTQARKLYTFDVDGYNYYTCNTDVYFDSGKVTIRAQNLDTGERAERATTALLSVTFSSPTERGSTCYPHRYSSFHEPVILAEAPTTPDNVMQPVTFSTTLSGLKFNFWPYLRFGEAYAEEISHGYTLRGYTPDDQILFSTGSAYGNFHLVRTPRAGSGH